VGKRQVDGNAFQLACIEDKSQSAVAELEYDVRDEHDLRSSPSRRFDASYLAECQRGSTDSTSENDL